MFQIKRYYLVFLIGGGGGLKKERKGIKKNPRLMIHNSYSRYIEKNK